MTTAQGKPLPEPVVQPLLQLLGWLGWLVMLLAIVRIIWAGGLLAIRTQREESTEGILAALIGGIVLGTAGLIAGALYAPP